MARKWIYLFEDGEVDEKSTENAEKEAMSASKEAQSASSGNQPKEAPAADSKTLHASAASDYKQAKEKYKEGNGLMYSAAQKKQAAIRQNRIEIQNAKKQQIQNNSSSLLDETDDNNDALPIDTKDQDPKEVKEKLKKDDVINEKQPLQEFMSFYRDIFNK